MVYKKKKYFIAVALLFVFWYLFNTVEIYRYSKIYSAQVSDVAIVLGAGSDQGVLSPVFRERVNHAVKLFEDGKVKFIIFTGGFGKGQAISDSKAAKLYAMEKGVPLSKIFIEEKSGITYENLKNAKGIMECNKFETALIVSDPLHMKRAMRICESHGITARPSPTQTTMYRSWDSKLDALMYESFYYNLNILFRW